MTPFLCFLRFHRRLLYSMAAGVAAFALWPMGMDFRMAVGWNVVALYYMADAMRLLSHAPAKQLREQARKMDISGVVLFALMILAAFFSLYLSLSLLHISEHQNEMVRGAVVALALATVVISWFFVQIIFAVHYAHHYYARKRNEGGLEFPQGHTGGEEPDFWDFVYFSFVLGTTFQVSDVDITRRHMRHLAMAHGIIAFFFNTFILALSVNIAANFFK